ncbi:hypothetical protein PR003_g30773 [Phytophthora rubi]|uniref:Uncharacterized protein n=1 Tax=Phytophthora rubi TaxID=129364 RepID=A0A6A4BD87_9STRA|nr:hypothetical protein PR001_g29650 [Phytophthora rubi]KAE9270578.1 hypothetical protein PR003_g30773 [Phytophthora rubi]
MALEPPPTGVGPSLRPPDPTELGRESRAAAERGHTRPQAEPPTQLPDLSGPLHSNLQATVSLPRAPDPVTTPSDAQGGHEAEMMRNDTAPPPTLGGGDAHRAAGPAGKTLSGSYASAVRLGSPGAMATTVHVPPTKVKGAWTPREHKLLLDTLARGWHKTHEPQESVYMKQLREVSLKPSAVHTDEALRPRTEMETEALLAYINKKLELPHAPTFLKATMPLIQRAMLEQFHEAHVEVTLTAVVAPRATYGAA